MINSQETAGGGEDEDAAADEEEHAEPAPRRGEDRRWRLLL